MLVIRKVDHFLEGFSVGKLEQTEGDHLFVCVAATLFFFLQKGEFGFHLRAEKGEDLIWLERESLAAVLMYLAQH